MVLEHYDDRPLVDGEKSICVPLLALAERVDEAELSPQPLAVPGQEVPQQGDDLGGRVRKAREGRCRADRAVVVVRRMRGIPLWIVTRRKPPAGLAVPFEFPRILNAMGTVYSDVMHVLCPVVGIAVLEPPWVQAAERVVREEQGAAVRHAERQLDAIPGFAIEKSA